MDNPALDIPTLIVRLLDPSSPDSQTRTIEKYFAPDASFAHPLCYIEASPDSRDRIVRLYRFLSLITPTCTAKIRRQSFNDTKGKMSLEMEITPMLRGVDAAGKAVERMSERWGFDGVLERFAVGFETDSAESRGGGNGSGRKIGIGAPWKGKGPVIPVHVFLTLARVENGGLVGPWRIRRQEIVFQPMDFLSALHLDWLGRILYYFLWLFIMTTVMMGEMGRAWNQKDFSVYQESKQLAKDGYRTLVVPPKNAAVWSYGRAKDTASWGYGRGKVLTRDRYSLARKRLAERKREQQPRIDTAKQAVRVTSWKLLEKILA